MISAEEVINIVHLRKFFGNNRVLKDVNLKIQRGENIVVLGKSGMGKSVFIKCLVRLVSCEAEKMEILGKEVMDLRLKELNELRRKIGFLFQGAALYDSMSVKENLEFPLRRHLSTLKKRSFSALVEEALENVGLKEAIHKMPSELSGGMRKRIGLARTLILKPEIMLYDEPTTGLDPITSREISDLILEVRRKYNTTSIIITHDVACARITADRMLVLQDGLFIAEGTYKDLSQSPIENVRAFFE
jgi:phospholipid/cholesterol/gamma-HCH transport system ATP-binding protein